MRPFCRDTRNGHVCHRMKGHPGPHIERHQQAGDDQSEIEWFTVADYGPPAAVRGAS